MPNKEEFELAQKELISFLSKFSGMMVEHLCQIREVMSSTTESVMDCVGHISDARDNKKRMAETILVKKDTNQDEAADVQGGDDTFKAVINNQGGDDPDQPATLRLKDHMKSFKNLDDRIEEILFLMIGSMSADDVVGQRMEHINEALGFMSNRLSTIIGTEAAKEFKTEDVEKLKSDILTLMKKSYTMVEEHQVMNKVFMKEADKKAS